MAQSEANQPATSSSSAPMAPQVTQPQQHALQDCHQQQADQPTAANSSCCLVVANKQAHEDGPRRPLLDNRENRVKVYYESKEVGQHELRLKYTDDEPVPVDAPVVFFVDIFGANIKKIACKLQIKRLVNSNH